MKRILIWMADFGYGHRDAANAIAEALQENRGHRCKELYNQRVQNALRLGYPHSAYEVADLAWAAVKEQINDFAKE
jgi:hypothetical protein